MATSSTSGGGAAFTLDENTPQHLINMEAHMSNTAEDLKEEIESLRDSVTRPPPEPRSFEEFKEMARRSHSEPRCKDYEAADVEQFQARYDIDASSIDVDEMWEDHYINYLRSEVEKLRFAEENPLIKGVIETLIEKGKQEVIERQQFQGKSYDYNTPS
jgi:hypothetical protein